MGYTTTFEGSFKTDKPVDKDTYQLLEGLNTTRRMTRKNLDAKYGIEGEFYFDDDEVGDFEDSNNPPRTQPGLWCGWEMLEDHQTIKWDEAEKFYYYCDWLIYIMERVLMPKGYSLSGTVLYHGESTSDAGRIEIRNNIMTKTDIRGEVTTYDPPVAMAERTFETHKRRAAREAFNAKEKTRSSMDR